MKWRKLGRVFVPQGELQWMRSHASNPVALVLGSRTVRIFFSTRDDNNRSHIASIEVDVATPLRVHRVSAEPLLSPGPPGAFDDSGVSVGCLSLTRDVLKLFYMGWNLGVSVPFRNSIGSATWSSRDEAFVRDGEGPLLDRSREDPFSLSYPMVTRDGSEVSMWYGSHLRWGVATEDMVHAIKVARTRDELDWSRSERSVLTPREEEGEIALARPWVVIDSDGSSRMWYCRRRKQEHYRLGYAASKDGIDWERHDDCVGLEPSREGWDSDDVCYPSIFDLGRDRYMLYCGNGYGREGFGLAILEQA